jgi:hypothetical protein
VSISVAARWRKALNVTRTNSPGTHRLVQANAVAVAAAIRAKEWTDEDRQAKRDQAQRLNLGRHLRPGYHGRWWTDREKKLLGKLPDEEAAQRTGRTVAAVRIKRTLAGLPTATDKRRTRRD